MAFSMDDMTWEQFVVVVVVVWVEEKGELGDCVRPHSSRAHSRYIACCRTSNTFRWPCSADAVLFTTRRYGIRQCCRNAEAGVVVVSVMWWDGVCCGGEDLFCW